MWHMLRIVYMTVLLVLSLNIKMNHIKLPVFNLSSIKISYFSTWYLTDFHIICPCLRTTLSFEVPSVSQFPIQWQAGCSQSLVDPINTPMDIIVKDSQNWAPGMRVLVKASHFTSPSKNLILQRTRLLATELTSSFWTEPGGICQ